MQILKYRSRNKSVYVLEELLVGLGYSVVVSNYFGRDTDVAVKDFQSHNKLVINGIVGPKTWSKLYVVHQQFTAFNNKLLSENDLQDFAKTYNLELPVVKAVNEIESNGKGFLLEGRPRILFEGHVFWRELVKRKINPLTLVTPYSNNVIYEKWTKRHYEGGNRT